MANSASPRVVLTGKSVAPVLCLVLGLTLLAAPATSRAADPDIPRLQVDAERGSVQKQLELASAYFAGRGVPQDEKRAAYWFERAANAGDPGAQAQIGYFYEAGIGVSRDPAQAVRWFQRAVAGGLISAKVNLGVAYLLGEGVTRDTAMAEDLFRRAYAQGNGMAACYLGEMYSYGTGVERDEAAGERWYEAGAKLHDPRAQFQLAYLLWHRQKNPDELKRAIRLLRESAAGGMVSAKHQLGVLLIRHPELAESRKEGPPELLKEAAEAGEWRSSIALGLLSRDGLASVPVDPRMTYFHYRVAVLQGGSEALKVVAHDLDAISARLGPEQTASIDADAKAWFGDHHLTLQFVCKDGGKWKEYPVYGVVAPDPGLHAGRLLPTNPSAAYIEEPNRGRLAR